MLQINIFITKIDHEEVTIFETRPVNFVVLNWSPILNIWNIIALIQSEDSGLEILNYSCRLYEND